uniref:WW domain-containing protein n=1 Tax=Physcomitrium patens TaxID=3218 RepID=A0A7I4EAD5_PHYPA
MGKRRDRRHAVLGGGGRRVKLDLRNDEDKVPLAAGFEGKSSMSDVSCTVEEGGEKTGVESDERQSPHSLPGSVQVNPLLLLGQYSDDEAEGEEQMLADGFSGGASAVAVVGQVDQKVASFLADLETSGILKDESSDHENKMEPEGTEEAKPPQDVDTEENELICEWEAVLHKESSEYYYWNKFTGVTTWEKPATYAEFEARKAKGLQNRVEIEKKCSVQDPQSSSEPAHEFSVQEDVSESDDAAVQDAKNIELMEEQCVAEIESGQLEGTGRKEASFDHSEKQDASSDHNGGIESGSLSETRESVERVYCSSESVIKFSADLQRDPDFSASAATVEHDAGDASKFKESMSLNMVENVVGAEDMNPAVGSTVSGHTGDRPTTADEVETTDLQNLDLKNVMEQSRRYDHQRLIERGEILVQGFKILAGEALRRLSSRLRLAVESEVRLCDCKAVAKHDSVEKQYWEYMDSQIARLEAILPIEQAAPSLETEQQNFISIEDGKPQSRGDGYMHGVGSTEHEPEAPGSSQLSLPKSERDFKPTIQLRSEDEDMDVDMDVDMEAEDDHNFGTSVAAGSVDNNVTNAMALSVPYESSVGQTVMYIPTPPLSQVVSYGHMGSLPPEAAYIPPAQSLPPMNDAPLFPVVPIFPSVAPVFPVMQSSVPLPQAESWVPPPPPEDEWVPPPLPDHEAPPPPDEDEPPHSSASGTNLSSQETPSTDRPSDGGKFGAIELDTGTAHINGNAVPSSGVSILPADTSTKKSTKGRVKKRSHSAAVGASLMSNKKVSTLVNKWLAAQEELHSSDEADEDKDMFDVEALERKRQKEIEEWRHQTLASGGALENANFQPLGTLDWRERVKKAKEASKLATKKGKSAKSEESQKEPTNVSDESSLDADKVAVNTTPPKRPDLKELTKGLPAGWQAFWDAESCEVYYGNVKTSETSWDRPS